MRPNNRLVYNDYSITICYIYDVFRCALDRLFVPAQHQNQSTYVGVCDLKTDLTPPRLELKRKASTPGGFGLGVIMPYPQLQTLEFIKTSNYIWSWQRKTVEIAGS